MSNFLAIATVTATLRQVLDDAVKAEVNGATATALRPNAAPGQLPSPGVNLFLYQISPSVSRRNDDLPSRGSEGRLTKRPRAAVDLHYLLSFYGSDAELEPQRVLGTTLRVMHEQPILQPQRIIEVIDATPCLKGPIRSNLNEEPEPVRFTQLPLSLEELAKLWSVFFQTPYVLSVAFVGTVVLIEGESAPRTPLPVRQRNLYVVPFGQPVIERVGSAAGVDQPVVAGGGLLIAGRGLRGDQTQVRVGPKVVVPPPQSVGEREIEVTLPADLPAGIHAAQVGHPRMMGTPPTPHGGAESNAVPFVLHPLMTPAVTAVTKTGAGAEKVATATVRVSFVPPVGRAQRVKLLLNELDPPEDRPARAGTFDAPADNGIVNDDQETSWIDFSVEILEGSYLCRVQVDGAESLLVSDASGRFASPKVTL